MNKLYLSLALIISSVLAYGETIRVPQDHTSVQEAVDMASAGDTILVTEGTYIENLVIPRKELTIGSLYLTTGDTSYISKTIIDGNHNGPVVNFGPGDGEMMDNMFTGFTIMNGSNDEGLGGGIYISQASPVLTYLKILNNSANRGGGIACLGSPVLNLAHSVLSQNQATNRGAAIFVVNSGLDISNCLISGNEISGGIGGAIYFSIAAPLPQAPEIIMSDVRILNNTASGTGATAGAYFENPAMVPGLNILIENCTFQENRSIGNTAFRVNGQQMNARVFNCSFVSNEAVQYGGGAVFTGGSKGEVINCLFISNKAATGGGDWNSGAATVWGSEVDFYNCTFVNNTSSYGTVITVGGGKAVFENCILWENNSNPIALVDAGQNGGELTVSHCNLQNGQGSVTVSAMSTLHWNNGNIDTDPFFAGDGDHPYALDPDSPCIDAGNSDSGSLPDVTQDFLGNQRIWDGDGDEDIVIDMGPYEYGSELISSLSILQNAPIQEIEVLVYPNPFTFSTAFEYHLIHPEKVQLTIYHVSGKIVRIIREERSFGLQHIYFYPKDLDAGPYFFRLEAGNKISTGIIIFTQ